MFDVFGWEAWKWVAHLLISVWEVVSRLSRGYKRFAGGREQSLLADLS